MKNPLRRFSTSDPSHEAAYDVVRLSEVWGVLALLFFAGSLFTRQLVNLLPWALRGWTTIPPTAVTLVPILALLGTCAALLGLRKQAPRSRSLTRVALYLNLVVLGISVLIVLLIVAIRLLRIL